MKGNEKKMTAEMKRRLKEKKKRKKENVAEEDQRNLMLENENLS